jgi:uncharacterized protein (TIGR00369 family)
MTETAVPKGFVPFPFSTGFASLVGPIYVTRRGKEIVLGFRVEDRHCNPAGICHGGMMMTVMDMAVGSNIASHGGVEAFTPSVQLAYDFLQPGKPGQWLESKTDFVHTTRRTGFANGYLIGPDGPVMRANGICKLPNPDDPRFQMGGKRRFVFDKLKEEGEAD